MNYDIEADWHLLNTCNYRCPYCFCSPEMLSSKLRTVAKPEEWRRAFDASGHRWLIHITGGEPGAYPEFVELCEGLTKQHYLSINSNLTYRIFDDFSDRIDPSRVSFVNAGFHLEERERRSGMPVFFKNVERLHAKKFPILVSMVATPVALARFEEAVELLAPIGFFPIPKLLQGSHEGRKYPQAYTDFDKQRFRKYAGMARSRYEPLLAGRSERPTIDMFKDDDLLGGEPSFLDETCEAGRLFVRIDPAGEIFRCGTSVSIGNIRHGTFKRHSGPSPCDTAYCTYFCQKYAKSSGFGQGRETPA